VRARPRRRYQGILRCLALATMLIVLLPAGRSMRTPAVHADAPIYNPAYVPPTSTATNRTMCIDAGEGMPCFALTDLQLWVPKWTISPPAWNEYPPVLDAVPLVARTYSTDTIEYLATHEIASGDPASTTFALTFDCETYPKRVQQIVDTLHREKVQATFFLQGSFAYRNPGIVRQMLANGHELGSHSFFHPLFTDLTPLQIAQEITYTEAAIAWAAGEYVPLRYFRFPYAGRNGYTLREVARLGYQSSYWNMDPRGWEPDKTAKDVVDYVRQRAHGGGIVILHCSSLNDVNALPGILQAVRDHGLQPGTLSEVLRPGDRDVPGYSPLPDP
jgi:peptidoglycan/xylan/chitin deacetylase (PgdA/CDA1 family)